ncbi:hypothetical protein DL766_003395 [Monosporascus sp. MC13-8B]|uniref:Ig-like domain-containing protein n=1 Tax=Monosporascus cannonballus TaxID=155416 RepID=A0ABY0GTY4_9PEZI|nr:hypothetical protein DL762_009352 [Monosporascus cannonballus]RYO89072.1 hypothetical protein DL763_005782 [Monosporascus cannonballus]RYP33559.1 hypothetical protein DL766_003395 [Monosporascus sp. MC13-8B]
MGNTSSSTKSFPTPTATGHSSLGIVTHEPAITSDPYATATDWYTSVVPVYTTSRYVEEICRHGVYDYDTETCHTSTKSITRMVSFSTSLIPASSEEPWDTSTSSTFAWCPDYPDCSEGPTSRSTRSRSSHTHSTSSTSRSTTRLSTRSSTLSYNSTTTLWDNTSTENPWLPTFTIPESLSIPTMSESYTDDWFSLTSEEYTSTDYDSTLTDSDSWCTGWWCDPTPTDTDYLISSTSSSSWSRRRTSTTSSDTFGSTSTLDWDSLTMPFPEPTITYDPNEQCATYDYWWCTSTSSSSLSTRSASTDCYWWDTDCTVSEYPPYSTEVPGTPCDATSTSLSSWRPRTTFSTWTRSTRTPRYSTPPDIFTTVVPGYEPDDSEDESPSGH